MENYFGYSDAHTTTYSIARISVMDQDIRGDESSMQFIIISHDAEIFEDSSVENIYRFESAVDGTIVNPL